MNDIDLKRAHEVANDLWQFYRRNATEERAGNSDEYWQNVKEEAEALVKKYGAKRKSVLSLILDVIDALEEIVER